jgi:hypothetical protein
MKKLRWLVKDSQRDSQWAKKTVNRWYNQVWKDLEIVWIVRY